jgi:hypothetical protein
MDRLLRLDLTLKIECISFSPISAFDIHQAKQAFLISFFSARAFASHFSLKRVFALCAREVLSGVKSKNFRSLSLVFNFRHFLIPVGFLLC